MLSFASLVTFRQSFLQYGHLALRKNLPRIKMSKEVDKTPVCILMEFCTKKKLPTPKFIFRSNECHGFVCRIEIQNMCALGNGNTKRQAKQWAAKNCIDLIRESYPEIGQAPVPLNNIPPTNAVHNLRDFCLKSKRDVPTYSTSEEMAFSSSPKFTVQCSLEGLCCLGVARNKRNAHRIAAQSMLEAIMGKHPDVATSSNGTKDAKDTNA